VYFSPDTRNFYADEFVRSYRGILILLMQKHLEFQIVTPRTLKNFRGDALILPDVRVLAQEEKSWLREYAQGHSLIVTGEDSTGFGEMSHLFRFASCPGKAYMSELESDFARARPDSQAAFLSSLKNEPAIEIVASPLLATSLALVDGAPHIFLANFAGLGGGRTAVPTPQTGVQVTVPRQAKAKAFFLPFLGDPQELKGVERDGRVSYSLPAIARGAVFWYQTGEAEKESE
jgi:hypothetical protein